MKWHWGLWALLCIDISYIIGLLKILLYMESLDIYGYCFYGHAVVAVKIHLVAQRLVPWLMRAKLTECTETKTRMFLSIKYSLKWICRISILLCWCHCCRVCGVTISTDFYSFLWNLVPSNNVNDRFAGCIFRSLHSQFAELCGLCTYVCCRVFNHIHW